LRIIDFLININLIGILLLNQKEKAMVSYLRIAALLLLFFVVSNQAQVWDYEKQRTLTEMITLRQEILNYKHPIFSGSEVGKFTLNNFAVTSRIQLSYLGKQRQIPTTKLQLLDAFARTLSLHPAAIKSLKEEVLFREGDKKYWIPLKKEIIAVLEKLKTGDEVMFYIDLIGAYRTKDKWEWVFTINELARQ
jgi:hypothetical protein